MAIQADFGGNTLYANDFVYGATLPGSLSGTTLSTTISNLGTTPKTASVTTATLAPAATATGTIYTLNRAAGSTITLPAPVVGTTFTFIVGTVTTGGNVYKIITSAGTVFISGGIYIDKALTITRYDGDTSTFVSINLNGTTTGGATIGDKITLDCVSATQWTVSGTVTASGTLATPFATS